MKPIADMTELTNETILWSNKQALYFDTQLIILSY